MVLVCCFLFGDFGPSKSMKTCHRSPMPAALQWQDIRPQNSRAHCTSGSHPSPCIHQKRCLKRQHRRQETATKALPLSIEFSRPSGLRRRRRGPRTAEGARPGSDSRQGAHKLRHPPSRSARFRSCCATCGGMVGWWDEEGRWLCASSVSRNVCVLDLLATWIRS